MGRDPSYIFYCLKIPCRSSPFSHIHQKFFKKIFVSTTVFTTRELQIYIINISSSTIALFSLQPYWGLESGPKQETKKTKLPSNNLQHPDRYSAMPQFSHLHSGVKTSPAQRATAWTRCTPPLDPFWDLDRLFS